MVVLQAPWVRRYVGPIASMALVACYSNLDSARRLTGRNPRSDGALRAAANDLKCPIQDLGVVAETSRRSLNETTLRFVIEGCGRRGSYLETCDLVADVRAAMAEGWTVVEDNLMCRYILVASLSLENAPSAAPPGAARSLPAADAAPSLPAADVAP